MKGIKKILQFALLAAALVFALNSCSDDDDDSPSTVATYYSDEDAFKFYSDGTFVWHMKGTDSENEFNVTLVNDYDVWTGTYSGSPKSDGTLTLTVTKSIDFEETSSICDKYVTAQKEAGKTTVTLDNSVFPLVATSETHTATVSGTELQVSFEYEGFEITFTFNSDPNYEKDKQDESLAGKILVNDDESIILEFNSDGTKATIFLDEDEDGEFDPSEVSYDNGVLIWTDEHHGETSEHQIPLKIRGGGYFLCVEDYTSTEQKLDTTFYGDLDDKDDSQKITFGGTTEGSTVTGVFGHGSNKATYTSSIEHYDISNGIIKIQQDNWTTDDDSSPSPWFYYDGKNCVWESVKMHRTSKSVEELTAQSN